MMRRARAPRREAAPVRLEAATGLWPGGREMQEDAVLCDVPQGGAAGIVVLADGLGGHAGGAVASRLAVATALGELSARRDAEGAIAGDVPALLRAAAEAANDAVIARAGQAPEIEGMGTTLLVALVQRGDLHWVSVGDSPLFLLRGGCLRQLNETHSLATHLDLLVEVGEMAPEEAAAHPGRTCLTSALGSRQIERIDCPDGPVRLEAGDVLVAASDGLLTLAPDRIGAIAGARGARSADLARQLLDAVMQSGAEGQDNVSLAVLRAEPHRPESRPARAGGVRAAAGRALTALRRAATAPGARAAGPPRAPSAARSALEAPE